MFIGIYVPCRCTLGPRIMGPNERLIKRMMCTFFFPTYNTYYPCSLSNPQKLLSNTQANPLLIPHPTPREHAFVYGQNKRGDNTIVGESRFMLICNTTQFINSQTMRNSTSRQLRQAELLLFPPWLDAGSGKWASLQLLLNL